MKLIQRITVSSPVNLLTFNNIPQTGGDLVIIGNARNTGNSIRLRFYMNTGESYWTTALEVNAGSAYAFQEFPNITVANGIHPGTDTVANNFGYFWARFFNYNNTNAAKTIFSQTAQMTTGTSPRHITFMGSKNNSTSAITSISITPEANSFDTNSIFSLYRIPATSTSYVWDFTTGIENFTTNASTISASGGILTWTATAGDPFLVSPSISVSGSSARYIKITWRRSVATQSGTWAGQIFYSTPGHGDSESFTKFFDQPTWIDGYQTTVIDMGTAIGAPDYINSTITRLRFDFTNGAEGGTSYLIDKIELSSTP